MNGYLSSGSITSENCQFGDYVIEWRQWSYTGTIVLISGEGSDPVIQVQHPFYSYVVECGIYYPVIRYVYIDGISYSPYPGVGDIYSPDLLECLDTVAVCDDYTTTTSTTSTTTTEPTTTTTTTILTYRASISVGPGPDYNMATDTNVPYSENVSIEVQSPTLSGYNYFFVSAPTSRTLTIINSMGINVTSDYTAIGFDNRAGFYGNTVYRKNSVFYTGFSVKFFLTFST